VASAVSISSGALSFCGRSLGDLGTAGAGLEGSNLGLGPTDLFGSVTGREPCRDLNLGLASGLCRGHSGTEPHRIQARQDLTWCDPVPLLNQNVPDALGGIRRPG
jgi:hypothetical protein